MKKSETKSKYEHIIHLPHKQSTKRPHMSMHERAAQFAPFAPLVRRGGEDADADNGKDTRE